MKRLLIGLFILAIVCAGANAEEMKSASASEENFTPTALDSRDLELQSLYAEAKSLKLNGQNNEQVWNHIRELRGPDRFQSNLDTGGDDCAGAVLISSLPFCDVGNTSSFQNSYEVPSEYDCSSMPPGSSGRDVVYKYTPAVNEIVTVSLCGSGFDTYLHIWEGLCPDDENGTLVCCNDDHNSTCPPSEDNLQSCCPDVPMTQGTTYYIVVDGWRISSYGDYILNVNTYGVCAPCGVEGPGACCYTVPDVGPACADDITFDECMVLGGTWNPGVTCDAICCERNYCEFPIVIPNTLYYVSTVNNCCASNSVPCVWQSACVGPSCWTALNAVVYKFVIESAAILDLAVSGPGDNQLLVFTDCEQPTQSCVGSADIAEPSDGGTETISGLQLDAGTYYVSTSHWNEACYDITLEIWSDTPLAVELMSLEAAPADRAITLNWRTASETNSDHFEIVRNEAVVGRIEAANSPTGGSYSWTESNLVNGTEYTFKLVAVNADGSRSELGSISATPVFSAAAVTEYALHQNYPNPFNPETSIAFDIAEAGLVTLQVYNPLGQVVATLVNGTLDAGRHQVSFDAATLSSGLYFYRMDAGEFSAIKKMVLMK